MLLPVENLTLEDLVIVRPGERLPVDGEVALGRSYIDESPITGESLPIEKSPGSKVFAGSLNADGTLEVRVSRLAQDSTLARVMKMVEQAQGSRSPVQLKVEQFTRIFVPIALAVFLMILIYPVLAGQPFGQGFRTAVTFLIATSPCALALGTPSAILSGIAQAARNGVLVKGGVHLEQLGRLKALAFDKTGTLTMGEPRVTEVVALPGWSEERILELAASIEGRSNHPLAQAITQETAQRGLTPTAAEEVESLTGRGIRARLKQRQIWIGGKTLWQEQALALPESLRQPIHELEAQGKTIILVGEEQAAVGLIAVADTLRPETKTVLQVLSKYGITHTVMLSGDNRRAAAEIAAKAGLSEFRAELLPEEKLAVVNDLVRDFQSVGMVGDGVNDAPALAQATVGIALGSAQNDVALEAADVALMAPDLCKLPFAIGLGRAVQRITLQNLALSLGSILVLSGLSLAGVLGIGPTVLIHEGVTLLVVANALRLFRFRQPCSVLA
jgi:Cd2+/Zn2+-exporting ATPase